MAAHDSKAARRAVNPPSSLEISILDMVEAGLTVVPRPDIGAVEIVVRDHGQVADTIILAPNQAGRGRRAARRRRPRARRGGCAPPARSTLTGLRSDEKWPEIKPA